MRQNWHLTFCTFLIFVLLGCAVKQSTKTVEGGYEIIEYQTDRQLSADSILLHGEVFSKLDSQLISTAIIEIEKYESGLVTDENSEFIVSLPKRNAIITVQATGHTDLIVKVEDAFGGKAVKCRIYLGTVIEY